MNLLVDTHIVIWSLLEPEKISPNFIRDIVSPANQIWVSSITVWEIVTKIKVGKLTLEEGFCDQISGQGFQIVPFESSHALRVLNLPLHHRDPFDRGLMAHASFEKFKFYTADRTLSLYSDQLDLVMMD